MTRKKPGLANLATLLVFVSSIGLSQAAMAAPCTAQVDALKAALDDGICQFSKACDGLSHKLDNANHKLEQGKFSHASRRLADFGAIVENLAMQKKPLISMADYDALMNPFFTDAAICVASGGVNEEGPDSTPDQPDDGGVNEPPVGQL